MLYEGGLAEPRPSNLEFNTLISLWPLHLSETLKGTCTLNRGLICNEINID